MRNRIRSAKLAMLLALIFSLLALPGCSGGGGSTPVLVITTVSLPGGTVGTQYFQSLTASGGKAPYNWSVVAGSLPDNLTLNGGTGSISGNPTDDGTFNFTIQVTDSKGKVAQKAFSITIGERMWRVTARLTEVRSPWPSVGQEYDIILKVNGQTQSSHQFVNDVWIPINLRIDLDLPESALAKIEVIVDPAAAVNGGIPQSLTLYNDNPPDLEGPFSGESSIEVWPGHQTNQYWTYFKWQVSAAPL